MVLHLFLSLGAVEELLKYGILLEVFLQFQCNIPRFICQHLLSGKCMKTIEGHDDYVTAVHFHRNSDHIVSCALDGHM